MPNADPYLLPMAGLLTAIGLTEIYRLGPDDAFKQALWVVIGVALFAVTLICLRRDYRVLESYKYLFGIGAIVLLFLPRLPASARPSTARGSGCTSGASSSSRASSRRSSLIVFLAAYLREKREVLAQGRLKDLGPLLLIWGATMLVLVVTNDLGSALLYFGIFLAMLYIATARALVRRGRRRALRSRRRRRLPRRSATSTSASRSGSTRGRSRRCSARRPAGWRCARTARATSS